MMLGYLINIKNIHLLVLVYTNMKGNPISVVHVDDDEGYCQIVAQLLDNISPNTYSITSFHSAKEAFFHINSNPTYDIIISDYDMPELNGLELFNHLQQSGIKIPFILLTGNRTEELPIKAINMGINLFLRKEIDFVPLVKQLDNLIKITVSNVQAQNDLAENQKMITDFISILTGNYKGLNDEIYTHILFQQILKSFLDVSQSQFVFLNFLQKNNEGDPCLSPNFLTSVSWSKEKGYAFTNYKEQDFPFKILHQYFNAILLNNGPVIANSLEEAILNLHHDFLQDNSLNNFLGLPIIFNKTIVGIIGLINREKDFNERLVFELQPFCQNLANYMYLKLYIDELKKNTSTKELNSLITEN